MASFRCYDNSDVIATLMITNFHPYLMQLRWQLFKIFVYGDVVYAQSCIDPEKLHRATLTSAEKTTEPKRHMLICPDNLAKVHSFSFNLDLRFHFTVQLHPIVRLHARNRTYFSGKYRS